MAVRKLFHFLFTMLAIVVLIFTCNTVKNPSDIFDQDETELGNGEMKWLAQSDSFSILAARWLKQGEVFYRNLKVLHQSDTIFADSTTAYYTNYGLLPIVRHLDNGKTEVLLGFVSDNDFQIDMLQMMFSPQKLLSIDTLPMFDGNHFDYDEDGQVEFSGFLGGFPTYCFDCDSDYYRPKLFYEMSLEGMAFDSIATKMWVEQTYGGFYGFTPDSSRVLPITSQNLK